MKEKNIILKIGKSASLICFWLAIMLIAFPVANDNISVMAEADIEITDSSQPAVAALAQVSPVSEKLIPLGKTTGIKMFSEGTMIVGFADISECGGVSPAKEAGLKIGDVITSLDGQAIESNEDLVKKLACMEDGQAVFNVKRDEEELEITVNAYYDESKGEYRLGAWIRDSIAGIGTITFVDPENGAFGALGHGICDADTGELMPFASGGIMNSTVDEVKKGEAGTPGELTGSFDMTKDSGTLFSNTCKGIFGQITDEEVYAGQEAVELANKDEIETGKAQIICNVSGTETDTFDIEIVKVYPDSDDNMRDMMIKVTDEELLSLTGGIVQGMSGSPIIQNGKLVGAVTHVLVNDPQRGYGISIEKMLAETTIY